MFQIQLEFVPHDFRHYLLRHDGKNHLIENVSIYIYYALSLVRKDDLYFLPLESRITAASLKKSKTTRRPVSRYSNTNSRLILFSAYIRINLL